MPLRKVQYSHVHKLHASTDSYLMKSFQMMLICYDPLEINILFIKYGLHFKMLQIIEKEEKKTHKASIQIYLTQPWIRPAIASTYQDVPNLGVVTQQNSILAGRYLS